MNKVLSQQLAREINALHDNIKAEILVASLLKAGVPEQALKVDHVGSFTRPYRKDMLGTAVSEDDKGNYKLRLQVSRNGIYDLLPEALSHSQQLEQQASPDGNALTEGYRRRKKEEALARKFFQPFEQEFFMLAVALEQEEQELLYHPSSAFYRFLLQFWGIAQDLPSRYEAALLRLLPRLHSIAGDVEAVAACMQIVLQLPVYHQAEYRNQPLEADYNKLGKGRLGQSFTMGCYVHAVPCLVFTIGPVQVHQLPDLLPGGGADRFLKILMAYALPFEVEAEIKVLCDREVQQQGQGGTSLGVLGYSAYL